MKTRLVIASVAAALLASVAATSAQTSSSTTTTTTTTRTTVTDEQQTKIKAYVTKQKPVSVTAPSGFTVTTGATLPETVELETLPADIGVTGYRYTVIGDRTVVVEPGTRRIIEVID